MEIHPEQQQSMALYAQLRGQRRFDGGKGQKVGSCSQCAYKNKV